MIIQSVDVQDFRNYRQQHVEFNSRVNIFIGANGQGKTNLLEAIQILTKGASFRPGKSQTWINHAADNSFLQGHFETANGLTHKVKVRLGQSQKQIQINEKRASSVVLAQQLPTVLFSPECLAAIKEGPEQRRLLVDEFLGSYDPRSIALQADYKKCLRARNRVLKEIKEAGPGLSREQNLTLESITDSFMPLATQFTKIRIEAIKAIIPLLKETMAMVSGDKNVDSSVDYLVSSANALNWSDEEIFKGLDQRRVELAGAEKSVGISLFGPHKHDIQFLHNGRDSRFYSSQGQQRALILSFKMAQIMYHYKALNDYPVLLLDDVLSELDEEKRGRLIEFLTGIHSQIFLTSTELSFQGVFGDDMLTVFEVDEGSVCKV